WYEREVGKGVFLRTKRLASWFGGKQTGSLLVFDPNVEGVRVEPVLSAMCAPTSVLAESVGAVAAINGGFFGGSCVSVSLVQVEGRALAANARDRSAVGFRDDGSVVFGTVAANQRWQEVKHALGAGPRLVQAGQPSVRTIEESFSDDFANARHPRSAVGLTQGGK